MNERLKIIVLLLAIIGLMYILKMIISNKIDLKYSLTWIITGIFIVVLGLFPSIITYIASTLGIAEDINALFFLGFMLISMITLSLTIAQSRNSQKIKEITQHVALLEKKIEEEKK